jgi:hypothetical protein
VKPLALLKERIPTCIERVTDLYIGAEVGITSEYLGLRVITLSASRHGAQQNHSGNKQQHLHEKLTIPFLYSAARRPMEESQQDQVQDSQRGA